MQADWELCKENFQPLKRGRKEVCKQETKVCQKGDVDSQRRVFWQELETYSGEDPLDVWIRFIKWTQDTFRSGGHQAELLPLLERCTRELQHIHKYKSDIRYLRIWIQYADCLPEPRDVFNFLKENSIGQDFALYYLAYAAYMELRGNFSKADAIFQHGLDRMAHPIDRLRAKYDDFQHRMAKRLEQKEAETWDTPDDPVRSSLAVLSVHNKPSRQQQQPATAAAGTFALARPKRKAACNPGKENTGGLEVFVDDEFKAGKAGIKYASVVPTSGLWEKLGGFEQNRLPLETLTSMTAAPDVAVGRRKENVQKASKWSEQKLPQKNTLVQPAIPVLDIPVDDDIRNQPSHERPNSIPKSMPGEHHASEPSKRRCPAEAQSTCEASALKAHVQGQTAVVQAVESTASDVGPARQPASMSSKKHEVSSYTADLLVSSSGQELSFEEVRAASWFARQDRRQKVAASTADDAAHSALPPVGPAPSIPASSADRISLLSPLNAAPSVPSDVAMTLAPSPTAASLPDPPVVLPVPVAAVPCPSTAAYAAGSKQGFMPHRACSRRVGVSTAIQQCASPTMHTLRLPDMTSNVTMATKDAFACVNAMFSSSLSHESCPIPKPVAIVEPTVTISTKAAFAELNQMFSSDLPHCKQRSDVTLPRPAARRTIGNKLPLERRADLHADNAKGTLNAAAVGPAQPPKCASQPAEVPGMYEDTCLLDNSKPEASKADFCDYAVYEDTKLRGDQARPQQLAASPTGNQVAGDFSIYEDTQCIQGRSGLQAIPVAGQDAALGIYEDTQFINKGAVAAAAPVTSPAGFGIYEDTQFIHKADCTFTMRQPPDEQDVDGLSMYEDTQFLHKQSRSTAAATSSPGGLGFYEDTQLRSSTAGRHAHLKTEVPASVLAVKPDEVEDKENQAGSARPFARDIGSPAVQAVALRPLSCHQAGQLGLRHLNQADGCGDAQQSCQANKQSVSDGIEPVHGSSQRAVQQHLAHQVQSASEQMSPFRQRFQSVQTPQPAAPARPCILDPFDPDLHKSLLAGLDPPVDQWADVVVVAARCAELDKLKQVRRQGSKPVPMQLGGQITVVQQKLGQGAFASVYQVAQLHDQKKKSAAASDSQALKIQSPPCPWEFYISKVLQGRLPPVSRSLFLNAQTLYLLPDHSVMITPFGKRGTLQDLLNSYLRKGKKMEEVVVMHYAMELLRITGALHAAHVIHTDIKPDNLLLADAATAALPAWQVHRPGLWSQTGLCLIDYGRAIDTALLPVHTQFKGDSHTDAFRCIEMQEGRSWGWGIDAFGVCSTVHCLLFGDYMEVEKTIDADGKVGYRLKAQLKRYWAMQLWQTFFEALLQPSDPSAHPPCLMLLDMFCHHLQQNPAAARKLRSELIRQDNTT